VFTVPVVRSVAGILHGRAATGLGLAEGVAEGEALADADGLGLGLLASALELPHAVTRNSTNRAARRIGAGIVTADFAS
jgi:hypothetical protein